MSGNPYHDNHSGEFTSKSGGAVGHNAKMGNRIIAAHIKNRHKENTANHGLLHKFKKAVGAVISGVQKVESKITSGTKKVAGAIDSGVNKYSGKKGKK